MEEVKRNVVIKMVGKKQQRGLSTIIALLVLSIIIVIVFAIGAQSVWNMNYVNLDKYRKEAFFAAEGGVQEALLNFKNNEENWDLGLGSEAEPLSLSTGVHYFVQVADNTDGSTPTGPGGIAVPDGMICFVGTGKSENATQQVAVLVKSNNAGIFRFALAAKGNVSINSSLDVKGNIKVDGDLHFDANVDVLGDDTYNEGNVVCRNDLTGAGHLKLSAAAAQHECHVGSSSDGAPTDASPFVCPDAAIDEWLADGSTEPAPGKLPNPDMTELLPAGSYEDHTGTTAMNNTTLNLDGKTHYFPDGISFTKVTLSGSGTIVAGKPGKPGEIYFNNQCKVGQNAGNPCEVNIIALDGGDPADGANWKTNGTNGTVGGADITFECSHFIKGILFSHGGLQTGSSSSVVGTVISYRPDAVGTKASCDISFDPTINVNGFEGWFDQTGSFSIDDIKSWQRL